MTDLSPRRYLARDDRPGWPAYSTHFSIGAAADATSPRICAWCRSPFGDVFDPPVTPIVSLVHPSPDDDRTAYVTLVHIGCVDGMTDRIVGNAGPIVSLVDIDSVDSQRRCAGPDCPNDPSGAYSRIYARVSTADGIRLLCHDCTNATLHPDPRRGYGADDRIGGFYAGARDR